VLHAVRARKLPGRNATRIATTAYKFNDWGIADTTKVSGYVTLSSKQVSK